MEQRTIKPVVSEGPRRIAMTRQLLFAIVITACCCQCSRLPSGDTTTPDGLTIPSRHEPMAEPITPIASEVDLPQAVVNLGERLFQDDRLSASQRISCATCHPLDHAGMNNNVMQDAQTTAFYNIPTIFNTGDHFAYFWNGRAASLEAVVQASIEAEGTMDSSWSVIAPRLQSDETYPTLYADAFSDGRISKANTEKALATYVRSLVTPNAAFDRWLNGENLSEGALAGYRLFVDFGCVRCHQGSGIGGNMYASFREYLEARGNPRTTDLGRYNVTRDEGHQYQFKVPSLRNVAVTGPYFHDGSVEKLSDAVEIMAQYQLGRTISRSEANQIVTFLESLTGWRDGALIGGSE